MYLDKVILEILDSSGPSPVETISNSLLELGEIATVRDVNARLMALETREAVASEVRPGEDFYFSITRKGYRLLDKMR